MNGLDPAGMQDMRDMILSLVAEGRTVVLSSHLLDEVERTCDAVAIVDRGKVIRQGAITDLLAGSSFVVEVECSEPARAGALLNGTAIGGRVESRDHRARDHAAGGNRIATSSPRSTASWSEAASPCTGSRRSRPRSSRGSCRSPADWGRPNDRSIRCDRLGAGPDPPRARSRPPGFVDPDRRDDRHPVHGAAEAAGSDGGPDRRHHRHPHPLPHHPPPGPRLRTRSPTGRPAGRTSSTPWWPACCTSSASSWPPPWAARPDRSTSPRGCSAIWW